MEGGSSAPSYGGGWHGLRAKPGGGVFAKPAAGGGMEVGRWWVARVVRQPMLKPVA